MGLFGLKVGGKNHNHIQEQEPQGSVPQYYPNRQLHPNQNQHLPPPNVNHLHKRSETTNSYTESDFLSTGSSSSYTSTESIGYHPQHHSKPATSPRPVKKLPLALRPNLDMIGGDSQISAGRPDTVHTRGDEVSRSQPRQPYYPQKAPIAPVQQQKRENIPGNQNVHHSEQTYIVNPPKQRTSPRKPPPQVQTPEKHSHVSSQSATTITPEATIHQDVNLNTTPTFGISANASQQSLPRAVQGGDASMSKLGTPKRPSSNKVPQPPQQQDNSQYYNQSMYFGHQQPPVGPGAINTGAAVQNVHNEKEVLEDDATSEDDDSESASSDSFQPTQHPYYEQWKQYYQALAMQQQQQQQQQQRNSMYFQNNPQFNHMMPYGYPQMQMPYPNNGMNYMMHPQQQHFNPELQSQMLNLQLQQSLAKKQRRKSSQIRQTQSLQNINQQQSDSQYSTQPPHDYLEAYQRTKNVASDNVVETNELVRNSRRSTMKSTRSISEPQHAFKKRGDGQRVASLESNFKPQAFNVYSDDEDEEVESSVRVGHLGSLQDKDLEVNQAMSKLVLSVDKDESNGSRQISDYTKFLFDDSEQEGDEEDEGLQDDHNETIIADKAPPPNTQATLNRKDTTSSEESYNSIQNEENFRVASQPSSKLSPSTPGQRKGKRAHVQQDGSPSAVSPPQPEPGLMPQPWQLQTSFDLGNGNVSMPDLNMMLPPSNPMMQMQMPMNMPPHMMMPYNNMNMMGMNMGMGMGMGMNPMMYQNGGGHPAMNRHSMMMMMPQDSRRQSMMMYDNMPYSKRNSMPVGWHAKQPQPKLDSETQKRIKEFKKLRSSIASGNKTMEYRLLWAKMLITATNSKLYNYINIKGDFIPQQSQPQHIENNKAAFIKASVTHIVKIIKDIESGNGEIKTSLRCKAYFIYACLLKNDFVESYEQDFGIEKNIVAALKYFNKALDLNRRDPRVLYKLGEVYEYDISDEDMGNMAHSNGGIDEVTSAVDKAIDYYTNSAQYGYERAEEKLAKFGITIEAV